MRSAAPVPDVRLTYDDFLLFPDDGKRQELIDGVHHVTPSPRLRHQDLVGRLHFEFLLYLREQMGKAVDEMTPFEDAYARTDWSRFSKVPAFEAANRINAYGTYLTLERESLAK